MFALILVIALVVIIIFAGIRAAISSDREEKARQQLQDDTYRAIQARMTMDSEMLHVMKALIREAEQHSDRK